MVKRWVDVVEPHRDVLGGSLNEAVFAADLNDVVQRRGPLDYLYPEEFFAKTYPTDGLVNLLANVLRRLAGLGGDPVVNLQAAFGGGKTHALIALYHLASAPQRAAEAETVRRALDLAGIRQVPHCRRVAVFVGTGPGAGDMTPWGSIALQLGRYDLVAEDDRNRTAPGTERLHQVLGDEPVLILVDELAEYGVKARDLWPQLAAFVQELTQVVKVKERAVLVATLPASAPYGEEGERVLYQLQQILGRMEEHYELVSAEEIYEVVRRRLFQDLGDPAERERAVAAYWELYRELGDNVPGIHREPAYRERMLRAYPFHPELIDFLYERWSTFSTFQRTRGALRLLGEVVADLYKAGHSAPLIQPAHIDLENPQIRLELVKHIGSEYNGVIASDIAGPNAKAPRVDQRLGSEHVRHGVASGLATSIFFGSFSGAEEERRGVVLPWLRVSVLRPGIPPALVGDAMKGLEEELHYLHGENGLYRFTSQPNINRIVVDRATVVPDDQVLRELRSRMERSAGTELRTYLWPQAPQDVPDTKELKLAVLDPEHGKGAAGEGLARQLLERTGETIRTYRNTLLVLAPDASELAAVRKNLKRLLALRSIRDDKELWPRLSDDNKRKVEGDIRDCEGSVEFDVRRAYRHVARAKDGDLEWLDLGIPTVGERASLAQRVRRFLQERDILVDRIAPSKLLEKALGPEEKELPVSEVKERFLRYPELPMLTGPEVVDRAVLAGVQEKVLGVRVGGELYFGRKPAEGLLADAVLMRREVAEGVEGGKVESESGNGPGPGPGPEAAGGHPAGDAEGGAAVG